MIPSEIPSRPWQTLSADLFYVQQSWFLIVVDYYSKLGAALFQNNKPIAFASKALTPAETRYANIERELLAYSHLSRNFTPSQPESLLMR